MEEYVLSYYPEFKCIASKCKHTCCAGWEMNIDAESLSAYKGERSVFSNTLSKGINFKKSKLGGLYHMTSLCHKRDWEM